MLRQMSCEIFWWQYIFLRTLNVSFRHSFYLPVEDKNFFVGTVIQMQKL